VIKKSNAEGLELDTVTFLCWFVARGHRGLRSTSEKFTPTATSTPSMVIAFVLPILGPTAAAMGQQARRFSRGVFIAQKNPLLYK
jgi:hypothetical protein